MASGSTTSKAITCSSSAPCDVEAASLAASLSCLAAASAASLADAALSLASIASFLAFSAASLATAALVLGVVVGSSVAVPFLLFFPPSLGFGLFCSLSALVIAPA